MILRKWLVRGGSFKPGDAMCELEIEGEPKTFFENRLHPEDVGGIYHHFVAEGQEVQPSGHLLEFSDSTAGAMRFVLHENSHQPGEIFPWTIQQAAVHARAMFVLIGQKWLTLTDRNGKRRIASGPNPSSRSRDSGQVRAAS